MKVHRLSESLISKIAAGEVIERPASVVKELVENSLDAGAKNIRIETEEGGRRLIRVVDDGCGMGREDLLIAIERHATSKIRDERDLFRIGTLGFRGEALPAIAAVSWMEIETRCEDDETGSRLEIEGGLAPLGKTLKQGSCGRNRGTSITIRNLFYNTPARLKFLKSRETEYSHISNLVEALALSHPEVGFALDDEIHSPPQIHCRDRIGDLFGSELRDSLREISCPRLPLEMVGLVAGHQMTSSTAKSLYFFVNGRFVRDRTLTHAVLSAYENLLMKHRYPWVFLYLSVPPELVDVNVHPTKSEVRFAQASLVHDLVKEGVRAVLCENVASGLVRNVSEIPENLSERHIETGRFSAGKPWTGGKSSDNDARVSQEIGEMSLTSPYLKIIGQVHSTYLLCETPDKLILIDQHAAHERIGFEKLKRQYETGGVSRQALLIPETFEMKPSEAEILKMYLADLQKFGLEVEPFGRSSFILRAVPALLAGEDCVKLLVDLVDELQSFGKLGPLEEKIHEVLETIACHRQIRAGETLTHEEIGALIDEMEKTDRSYSCAHGRPTKVEIPFSEIEKWFKRRI